MNNNLLIISYYFPPLPGPASRRWAKFVKYLSQNKDIGISVVSSKNTFGSVKSSFKNDLDNINFNHFSLDSNYPKYLERLDLKKPTLIGKIMFRVQHYLIKKKTPGNYWDLSLFWDTHFESTIPNLITKHKINKVIISGPPFKYVEYLVKLKNELNTFELIFDYRDPWNDFNNPKTFDESRQKHEINLEKKILKQVDKIITVSESQKQLIQSIQPQCAPTFVVPNGFDHEDCITSNTKQEVNDKINLSHFGTLHQQKDYYWVPFLNAFSRLKIEQPKLYGQFAVNLIGHTPSEIVDYIKEKDLNVTIHGIIEPNLAYEYLNNADIALWFKYDGSPGEFATKFGDYLALKKYIWTFSVKGLVTEHIVQNKIGEVFYRDDNNLENTIYNKFISLVQNKKPVFNPSYNSEYLRISEITKELITVLNN